MGRKGDLVQAGDLAAALGLLTRLPVRVDAGWAAARGAGAAWAWPLAGVVVGGLAALAGAVALSAGLSAGLVAGIVLGVQILATGAMHEDGLADCADGFWGGWTRERRLEIMKDSRIGAYGVIALILSLGLRWQALVVVLGEGWLWAPLMAAGALSRVPMVALMYGLAPARAGGLSRSVGRPGASVLGLAAGVAFVVGLVALGPAVMGAAVAVGMVTVIWAAAARARIGGQTGDVLGAAQQLAEIAVLLVLARV